MDENLSGVYPVWETTSKEFAERLEKVGSAKAETVARKMRKLSATFASWAKGGRPTPDEKIRVIGEYVTCYRDALDVLSARPKP